MFGTLILNFVDFWLFWLLLKMANYLGNLLVTLSATKYKIMDKLPSQQYVLTFILSFDVEILAFFGFANVLATFKNGQLFVQPFGHPDKL